MCAMVDNPVKKAARSTTVTVKKATRATGAAAKKTAATITDDPRPPEGHARILASCAILTGALAFGQRRKRFEVHPLRPIDLLLYGLATDHLSRVITKESVRDVLRSPSARFKEPAAEGEHSEDVGGTGARH